MEQLVIILIIALISFFNWLFKKSAEARARRKLERETFQGGETLQRAEEPQPAAGESEDPDQSMRRLMEALGLPQDEAPPPIPRRVPAPPPIPAAPPVAPPPIPAAPPVALPPVPLARATVLPASRTPRPTPPAPSPPVLTPLRKMLASPDGLKKAVMLSEILGAPKSLRP